MLDAAEFRFGGWEIPALRRINDNRGEKSWPPLLTKCTEAKPHEPRHSRAEVNIFHISSSHFCLSGKKHKLSRNNLATLPPAEQFCVMCVVQKLAGIMICWCIRKTRSPLPHPPTHTQNTSALFAKLLQIFSNYPRPVPHHFAGRLKLRYKLRPSCSLFQIEAAGTMVFGDIIFITFFAAIKTCRSSRFFV